MPSHDPLFDVSGKTAIVTGASSGLGVTFAKVLAERGANVVLAARRVDRLAEVETAIKQAGGTAMSVACDVGESEQVAGLVAAAVERFGRVDILVNNAGIADDGGPAPEKLPHDLFERTVRVNLLGTWYCCRDVGAHMLGDGGGGSIINIASTSGIAASYEVPVAYIASKAAVIKLTAKLAVSWAGRGVRVNAIAPGWFTSELTDPIFAIPSFLDRAEKGAPMGRVGDPGELAGALLLLASDAGSFITGQTLVVDGGLTSTAAAPPLSGELSGIMNEWAPDGLGHPIKPE